MKKNLNFWVWISITHLAKDHKTYIYDNFMNKAFDFIKFLDHGLDLGV